MFSAEKTALVTGAGRGIGRALLNELLARNYQVLAIVRSSAHVEELNLLEPNRAQAVLCDVTQSDAEEKISAEIGKHFQHLDLLFNNAGFGASAYGIEDLQYDELDRVLSVNLYGPIRCIKASLPYLRRSEDAAIVNVSSRFGSSEWVVTEAVPCDQATYAYRIAKAAMNMLTCCLAVELKSENIRTFSVDPGKVKTRFGPRDANVEASECAKALVDLALDNTSSGMFLRASGEKVPW